MRKETVMNITEREIDDPEKGGVILEYVNFTKEFAEIKEYVSCLLYTSPSPRDCS